MKRHMTILNMLFKYGWLVNLSNCKIEFIKWGKLKFAIKHEYQTIVYYPIIF